MFVAFKSLDVDWDFYGEVCRLLLGRIKDTCRINMFRDGGFQAYFRGRQHEFGRETGNPGWPRNGRLFVRYDVQGPGGV